MRIPVLSNLIEQWQARRTEKKLNKFVAKRKLESQFREAESTIEQMRHNSREAREMGLTQLATEFAHQTEQLEAKLADYKKEALGR